MVNFYFLHFIAEESEPFLSKFLYEKRSKNIVEKALVLKTHLNLVLLIFL